MKLNVVAVVPLVAAAVNVGAGRAPMTTPIELDVVSPSLVAVATMVYAPGVE